jgi:hypothetical protein
VSSNDENNDKSDILSSVLFDYDNDITLLLGDEFDLSPEYSPSNSIKYICDDNSIEISELGVLTTKQVGNAQVVIQNHNLTVKTVNVDILPHYSITTNDNCKVQDNKVLCYEKNFSLKIDIVNSSDNIVFENITPEIYTQDNIQAIIKFGRLFVSSENSGSVFVNYPSLNFSIELEVIVD